MRNARQSKILEIIAKEDITTQSELSERLKECGFEVTQATLSRDIKDLELIKVSRKAQKAKYAVKPAESSEKFRRILKETVVSVKSSENIVVVHTLTGCANAAAEALDNTNQECILGTIAGDNTIFLVIDSKDNVPVIVKEIKEAVR